MKILLPLLVLGFLTIPCYSQEFSDCKVAAYFTPTESIESQMISLIDSATKTIHISSFGIQNQNIITALIKAKKRNIDIIVCEDKMQANGRGSLLQQLRNNNIPVIVKKVNVLEHNKFMVVDNQTVIMGSWNFSNNATKQDNSDVIITDCPSIIQKFENQWQHIYNRDK